jgi:UDP-glucose 4-epimerase
LALLDAGDQPIVLDDLGRGSPAFLEHFPSYVGDVADPAVLARLFADHPDIELAIHCAARTVISDSLTDPLTYYRENVVKTVQFVEALLGYGGRRLIFSSSAAVYGPTPTRIVTEDSPTQPVTPYAASKVMVERMLTDICAVTPLTALSLRYFNPIGSDPRHRSGPHDPAPSHVLGRLLAASAADEPFRIHGRDWDTPDGTPLRDFVHVWDVARAHVAAAHHWSTPEGRRGHEVINIGSGRGSTVRQLVDAFNQLTDQPVTVRYDERRPGDTVGCYASTAKAQELLGWQPTLTMSDAVFDAIAWVEHQQAEVLAGEADTVAPPGGE